MSPLLVSLVIVLRTVTITAQASTEHRYVVCSEDTKECHGFVDTSLTEATHAARAYGLTGTLWARTESDWKAGK